MDVDAALGAEVQSVMFRRRVTGQVMAERLGLRPSSISQKLHGKTPITVRELYAIADVLEVEPASLLPARE